MSLSRTTLALVIAILIVCGVAVGGSALLLFGPNTTPHEAPRSVIIPEEATIEAVVDSLQAEHILASTSTFRLVAAVTGWKKQLKAGHYQIRSGMSNYRLLDRFRRGLQDPVRITIPPGSRPKTVARVVGRELALDAETLLTAVRDSSLARELGTEPSHLFGYLLPETYAFYWQASPEQVIRRLKKSFDRFYEQELAQGADSLNLTKHEVVTLASIVEWEALYDAEKDTIAGVYHNRLERGWRLQADPTIQYVLIDETGDRTTRVLYEHLEIDHPYNTYRIRGLPPGPITNPSPSSLRAAAHPARHEYFYFVADGSGGHTFSRTLRDHNRAAEEYHRRLDERG